MTERKLVTVRQVAEIKPIEGADNIELAIVDGWQAVVKKGEFKVGDLALYYEIDSFLPASDERYAFLANKFIEWNGQKGHVLRTMKLRKQLSQGLLLPLAQFPEVTRRAWYQFSTFELTDRDFAEKLGVLKYEKESQDPEERKKNYFLRLYLRALYTFFPNKRRKVKGVSTFPSFIPKTDQERIQNICSRVKGSTEEYHVTVKMDGSSMTAWYRKEDGFGHASRNVKLGLGDGSHFTAMVEKYKLKEAMTLLGRDLAVQGEVCGPGINGGYEQLEEKDLFIFHVYDIAAKRRLGKIEREEVIEQLKGFGADLKSVPSLGVMTLEGFNNVDDFLAFAEGPGYKTKKREGVVFEKLDGSYSFKVVANSYLLKYS